MSAQSKQLSKIKIESQDNSGFSLGLFEDLVVRQRV